MEFIDAEYVAPAGGPGRTAEPNPYTDAIAEIALKVDANGKPKAKAFTLPRDENLAKAFARAKRQLSEAGAKNDPAVTVYSTLGSVIVKQGAVTKEDKTRAKVTFWAVKRQVKTRKPKGKTPPVEPTA